MVICVCGNVTDRQIQQAVCCGAVSDMGGLCKQLGVAAQCGQCGPQARELLTHCQTQQKVSQKGQENPVE